MNNSDEEDTPYICRCARVYGYQVDESIIEGNNTIELLSEDLYLAQGCGDCREDIFTKLEFWNGWEGDEDSL